MAFKIGRQLTKNDATVVDIFYDENFNHVKAEDAQDDTEKVSFFIVPLTGKSQREISDKMMSVSRKGKTTMQTGTAEMIRVLRSVIAVEGLETAQGRALNRMTEDVYDACPRWMLEELTEAIHKLNGTDQIEDDEGKIVDSDVPFVNESSEQ